MLSYILIVAIIATIILGSESFSFKNGRVINGLSTLKMSTTDGSGALVSHYEELSVNTLTGLSCIDITQGVQDILKRTGCKEGILTVLSKHSTVSVIINEFEPRFMDDLRQFLLKQAPPDYPYLHNDLDFRSGPPNWAGGDGAWRAFRRTQPPNAHSHIIATMLGTSETIPISSGALKIGTYQNVIVVDADGAKTRQIAIQVLGTK